MAILQTFDVTNPLDVVDHMSSATRTGEFTTGNKFRFQDLHRALFVVVHVVVYEVAYGIGVFYVACAVVGDVSVGGAHWLQLSRL